MNKEKLEIAQTEETIKKPTSRPNAKELLGSLELTTDFLDGIPAEKRWRETIGLVDEFVKSSGEEIGALAKEREFLYIDLIQKGLDGFLELRTKIINDTELTAKEKEQKIKVMNDTYKRSQQVRQEARAQALDKLLCDFLNPYLWTAQGGEIYNYDMGFETATTFDKQTNKYKSYWEPKVHFNKHLGKFLSPQDVIEIRKFIEGFFEQHHQVSSLVGKVQEKLRRKIDTAGYDPSAAEAILVELDRLPDGIKLGKYTRVVTDSHAISIILNGHDYDSMHGTEEEYLKSSGGVHFSGTVLNLIRDTSRTEKVIKHENEHALNDNLLGLHQTNLEEDAKWRISLVESTDESSEAELEKTFEQLVHDLLNSALGHENFFTRFADEVLANKLGNNDRTDKEILDVLNSSQLYYSLNVTDENIENLQQDIANGIERCLQGFRGRRRLPARPGILEKMAQQIPQQLFDFLRKKDFFEIKPVIQKLLDKEIVYKTREEMVAQVGRLLKAEVAPEKVRSLLSTNNPLLWKNITDKALARHGTFEEDTNDIRFKIKKKAKKTADRARKLSFDDSQFKDYVELSDEEKENFKNARELSSKLTTAGFRMLKEGASKGDNFEVYKCILRKILGKNSCSIIVESYLEPDPESQRNKKTTTVSINAEGPNGHAEKFMSFEEDQFDIQSVEVVIEELERETGF